MDRMTRRMAGGTVLGMAVALAALLVTATPARAQLGVAGGLNFNDLGDIEGDATASFESSTGYHVGAFYDLALGPFALRPGVYYRKVGTYEFVGLAGGDRAFDMSLVEVPVDLRYRVLPLPVFKLYVLGGPVLYFPSAEEGFDAAVKDVSYAVDLGVGAEFSLPGAGFTLQPELRYGIGVSDFTEETFEIEGQTITPSDSESLQGVALRLHVKF